MYIFVSAAFVAVPCRFGPFTSICPVNAFVSKLLVTLHDTKRISSQNRRTKIGTHFSVQLLAIWTLYFRILLDSIEF